MLKRSKPLWTIALTLASAALIASAGALAQGKGKGKGKNKGGDNDDSPSTPDVGDIEPVENCAIYYAGQHTAVGSVCVSVVGDDLVVDYLMEGDWLVSGTHLWVGDTLASAPRTNSGNPIPGQFPYHGSSTASDVYTYTIPLSQLNVEADALCTEDGTLLVGAHGSVSNGSSSESAWAGETRFTEKGNWATYFAVTPDCGGSEPKDPDPEEPDPYEEFITPPQGCYVARVGSTDAPLSYGEGIAIPGTNLYSDGIYLGFIQGNGLQAGVFTDAVYRAQKVLVIENGESRIAYEPPVNSGEGEYPALFGLQGSGDLQVQVLSCEVSSEYTPPVG